MSADEHGGDLFSHPGVVLDFSVNLNPLGMPNEVKQAIASHVDDYDTYPDPQCRALRQALADKHGTPPDAILCGNGASDVIFRVCAATRPRRILVAAPTFSEYERSAIQLGCRVHHHLLSQGNDFDVDHSFVGSITEGIDMVFCCQPNNPTGRLIAPDVLARIVRRTRQIGATLVVDECFLPFTAADSLIPKALQREHIVVISALTKTHALAGVRLGYAVTGNTDLLEAMSSAGPRWSVSTVAQVAGIAALGLDGWDEETRRVVMEERTFLTHELSSIGLRVFPSDTNFLLFSSPVELYQPLLERGILIRSCANFVGLDETYYRVALKLHDDNVRLVSAVAEVLHG